MSTGNGAAKGCGVVGFLAWHESCLNDMERCALAHGCHVSEFLSFNVMLHTLSTLLGAALWQACHSAQYRLWRRLPNMFCTQGTAIHTHPPQSASVAIWGVCREPVRGELFCRSKKQKAARADVHCMTTHALKQAGSELQAVHEPRSTTQL